MHIQASVELPLFEIDRTLQRAIAAGQEKFLPAVNCLQQYYEYLQMDE